jgi:hypothetical protein
LRKSNAKTIIGDLAVVNSETTIITDAQSALDVIASVGYEHNVTKNVVSDTGAS